MSKKRTPAFETLIAEFNKLPGVGRKSAERIAYHVLRAPKEDALALSDAIRAARERIRFCLVCFNLAEESPCPVCVDESRDRSRILVVEDPMDIAVFERPGFYNGLYHVLQGRLAPLRGVTPEKLRINELLKRIGPETCEVIIATNPDVEGDATALYIARQLAGKNIAVTRIGLGIPMGGSLEYVDGLTLQKAIEGRKSF